MFQVPLGDDGVIVLHGSDSFDPEELTRAVAPLGFEAFVGSRLSIAEQEIKRLLVTKGISSVWQMALLQEAVLPPEPDRDRAPLLRILAHMIERLAAERDFVIVDPYLLPDGNVDSGYLSELVCLLEPIAARTARLAVVTKQLNGSLWRELTNELGLRCPLCSVTHARSDRYHDRFWLADQARGLFVGTSLTGLGRRYAIVDYLDSKDVTAIVEDLRAEGLLAR